MVKENTKNGFSLAEALISMLVISMFFLATSKIMTQREPDDIISHSHGFCACYQSGGVKMDCVANNSPVKTTSGSGNKCAVTLPRDAVMYNIAIINDNTVNEKAVMVNESAEFYPANGKIIIDSGDYKDVLKDPDAKYDFNGDSGYKKTLLKLQPKATFLNDLSNPPKAIYISW